MIVFGVENHGHEIAKASGCSFNKNVDQVISRFDPATGQLLGGVIYQNFTGRSIGMHVAGFTPNWINKDLLWVCFDYPFTQLGCELVLGTVPAANTKALDFDLKLGFKEVTRVPDVFPNGDLVIVAMRREECRWLDITPNSFVRKRAA
ncbi:hypothetical protein [Pseudolabrys sp.]|uniref:hypothetical protein n=1 Tax=Pseudolabrys sp. TaxID=1960880 RepID=UPI003D0CB29F